MTRDEMRFALVKAAITGVCNTAIDFKDATTDAIDQADSVLAALGVPEDGACQSWHEAKQERLDAAESVVERLDAEIARLDRVGAHAGGFLAALRRIRRGDESNKGAAEPTAPVLADAARDGATPQVLEDARTAAPASSPRMTAADIARHLASSPYAAPSSPPSAADVDAVLREFGARRPAELTPWIRTLAAEVATLDAKCAKQINGMHDAVNAERARCIAIVRDATGGSLDGQRMVAAIEGGAP